MAVEVISWPNLYERYVAGPGFKLGILGLQIQRTAYCTTGARLTLDIVYANSDGSDETVQMHRLVRAFTVCLCDKYPFVMGRIKCQGKDTNL